MNKNKKYAIRKLAVGVASISIGMFISNTPEVAQTLGSVGGGVIQAFDNGTGNTSNETTKDWKPEGSIIAQGEDGVPWKLYENGYLLFKPEAGKDTLTNNRGETSWKVNYGLQIKAIGFSDKVYAPIDSTYLFSKKNNTDKELLTNLKYLDVSKIDTSKVVDMNNMFTGASNLTTLDVSKWDTSRVEYMSAMFEDATSLTTLDVSKWDTSKVKYMSSMFTGASSLTTLDVSKWDTSKVFNMSYMFRGASNLTTLDVSKWDTSKVVYMNNMFSEASSLTSLDVSKWDTSKVESMSEMFRGASNLTTLDVSKWDTSKVVYMDNMFRGASSLTSLDVSKWDTSKVEDMTDIFVATDKLKELKLGENFKNTTLTNNLFEHLDNHDYGNVYTNKWVKEDGSAGPFTIEEWNTAYRNDPVGMSGTWVRESTLTKYTLNFNSGTTEKITPIEVEKNTQTTLPTPKVDNTGYKFLGWSKTQDGEVITNTTNIGRPGETVTLYAKWEKVNNITKQRTPIEITTIYQGDEELFKGKRNETPGQAGEKEVITTYKVTPITGELTEPTTTENIITPMRPKVIKVGTEPTADVEKIPSLVRYEKDDSREKGQENITVKGKDGSKTIITTYTVNPKTGELVETVGKPVVVEPTETVVKVAAKDKVEVVNKKDGETIKITTSYEVNPKTGEIKEVKREDLLSKKGIPEVSEESTEFKGGVNPTESIVREDLPELKVAIIKDKENNILDVIKEDEEPKEIKGYKNTGKTEVDKDGHKVYIYEKVEESKSTPKENKVENTSKEEDNKESKKEVISKKEELPKTSASMLSTVGLLSIFGLRKNRKKDKK